MGLKKKLIEVIKSNDKLLVIAYCIENLNDPELVKLLSGFYRSTYDYTAVIAEHYGEKYPDKMIYYICHPDKKKSKGTYSGLGAMLYSTLQKLYFADLCGMVPVIEWGANLYSCYEPGMDHITKNAFEYYFEPVSEVDYKEIDDCKNVIVAREGQRYFFKKYREACHVEQDDVEMMGTLYKKYFHLNPTTKTYIEKNMDKVLADNTILAIHVRGTDFNLGLISHPKVITPEQYLSKAKELLSTGKYSKVFIATDDANALELFKKEFKDDLIYYEDVFRTKDHVGPHWAKNDRPLHHYMAGLEVLRDIYTLANCDALVCGWSSVSFAARYVNYSIGQKYKEVIVLDNGTYTKTSNEYKNTMRHHNKGNQK